VLNEKTVELLKTDVKRVKEVAELKGLDAENLTEAEFWCIVSDAIIHYKAMLKTELRRNGDTTY
jgi:hypothetical protein